MITVKGVTKVFGKDTVLSDINVSFGKGEIHGLVGPNGSGKTMLLRCICGFVRPTKGEITVDGKRIGIDVDHAPDVGLILEAPGFLMTYSGIHNLRYLAGLSGKADDAATLEAMRRVGLDPAMKKSVRKYSMGMRQRLGIAQAIMEKPKILLLDEPMNGLDQRGVAEMRDLFQALREQGVTIVLASHIQADISVLCDHIYRMENGALMEE